MRKADYTLLAALLKARTERATVNANNPRYSELVQHDYAQDAAKYRELAQAFADRASVNKTEFLKACGIE